MSDTDSDAILVILLMVFSVLVSFLFGTGIGETAVKREAIKANAAEYAPDQNGDAVFRWKTVNKCLGNM